ncbi:MAG TPA: lamin tail domain-containing protein [Kofleriaceae bacterium]|nr:lamin tail domain-containing protein [Kofleriaceae bacterium]
MKNFAFVLVVLSLGLAPACSGGDDDDGGGAGAGDCADLLPGDLVITEVMANPVGEDRGSEYFEVYNASADAIDATGLTLVYSLADGSGEQTHDVEGLTIEAGDYVALGGADPEALPDFIDYGFDNDLGALRNGGAALALRCGDQEIDRVEYASAEGDDGVAWQLDGAQTPDYIANDDPAHFCPATVEFASGMLGSPGEANESCTPVVPTGTCTDEDGERDVVSPVVGDLVITELMANPADIDADQEWFEVYAAADVDLNGVVAGRDVGDPTLVIDQPDCLHVAAGTYALFARNADPDANAGLPDVTATFDFSLVDAGTLFVGIGDEVLDQISWTDAPDNASLALDPDVLDPEANDDQASWITCAAPYGDGTNTGTPGESNEACGGGGGGDGTCTDADGSRDIVPPGAGDLRISEFMANPAAVNDEFGEWFEVEVLNDVDLNGLEIGQVSDPYAAQQTLNDAACLHFSAGDFVVFARNGTAAQNGGIPQVDFTTAQSLSQTGDGDALFIGSAGQVIDEISWVPADVVVGTAAVVAPGGGQFCQATAPYGAGDLGTPGTANPACP